MGLPYPCLMLVTEPCESLGPIVSQAIASGVNAVQWRDKRVRIGKRDPALAAMTSAVTEPALLIGNGDWQTLLRHGIRKIHLPEHSLPVGVVKHHAGHGAFVGKSVHSVRAAREAEMAGADYVVAGTIFASSSHPEIDPAGVDFLNAVCAAVTIPVLAIGGVTPERVASCVDAGAVGVAVLSAIMHAADPKDAARQFRDALDMAWENKRCR